MAIEVLVSNEQSSEEIDASRWAGLATATLRELGLQGDVELSVAFVTEEAIAALNERYLDHEGPTDVLSFALEESLPPEGRTSASRGAEAEPLLLGDVVICPAVAARNAPEHAGSYEAELALLLVHGILHLLGMDHVLDDEAREMELREEQLLELHFRKGLGR